VEERNRTWDKLDKAQEAFYRKKRIFFFFFWSTFWSIYSCGWGWYIHVYFQVEGGWQQHLACLEEVWELGLTVVIKKWASASKKRRKWRGIIGWVTWVMMWKL